MAEGDGPNAPEPLSRLLARSDAVTRELQRARERLADLADRYDAEEPLTSDAGKEGTSPRPAEDEAPPPTEDEAPPAAEDRFGDIVVVPEAEPPVEEPSLDRDIAMLQQAARRRLSDER